MRRLGTPLQKRLTVTMSAMMATLLTAAAMATVALAADVNTASSAATAPANAVAGMFPPGGAVWQPVGGDWSVPVLSADNTTWEHTAVRLPA